MFNKEIKKRIEILEERQAVLIRYISSQIDKENSVEVSTLPKGTKVILV